MKRSLEYDLILPFPIIDRDSFWYGTPYINPDQNDDELKVSTSLPFAVYKKETGQFTWVADRILKRMVYSTTSDKKFLKNISLAESEKLAIYFRVEWLLNGLEFCYQYSDKNMETNNLVKFDLNDEEGTIVYALIDLGYEDPPLNPVDEARLMNL